MPPTTPTLLTHTYRETLDLMIEARNYLAYKGQGERRARDPLRRLKMSCESFRVTSRLTHVMAWLMAQRAVQSGELTLDAALERFSLEDDRVCREDSFHDDDDLPDALRSLLDRSHQLYLRVARLDDMVRQRLH